MAFSPTEWTSKLAGGAAILLASLTGLVAVLVVPEKLPGAGLKAEALLTPVAAIDLVEPDVGKVIDFCARHTDSERGFVVFSNGTCVIIRDLSSDPVAMALQLLEESAYQGARFLSERTAEGDLIVTFTGPVFHWIPSDEQAVTTVWADGNLDTLFSESEKKVRKESWKPPADARLGLVARYRLLEDGYAPEVVKVIMPKTMAITQ